MSLFAAVEVAKRTDFKHQSKELGVGELVDEPLLEPNGQSYDKREATPLLSLGSNSVDLKLEEERAVRRKGLWIIEGQAYDFTDFVKRHPGGSAAIGLGQGIDCTELFKTYHLMRAPPESILKKYKVENLDNFDFGTSKYSFEENGFLMTIRQRGRDYFVSNNIDSKGSLFWKSFAIASIFIIGGLYYPAFVMGSVIAAFILGVLKGFTAVGAGHGMSHFSLFNKGWINTFVFRACSPMVISTHQIWSTSHIVSHHINTLTPQDLQDNYPVKRVQPAMPFKWFHRFQHVYIWLVYLFGVPLWTMSDLVESIPVLFTGRHAMRHFTILQRLENTCVLALNILITIAMPFFFLTWWRALIVCLVSNIPTSIMLVIQIAVNHEVPECASKTDPNNTKIDWGVHQVLTSHDFGVESTIALHMSGGLNMQVEHHLFPSVHYSHYPKLAKIVQQACKEFDLPYNTSKHIFEAVGKHYTLLKMNSKP